MGLLEQLKDHEGFRKYPYEDSEGILTIGYGWNLEANGLPKDMCEELLEQKIHDINVQLKEVEWYNKLSPIRKRVIIDMAYNLGIGGLLEFKKMIQAIKEDDYQTASLEMLDSKWARQVHGRADRLARMMKTNEVNNRWNY